jgi:hypothetical protein
VEAVVDKEKGHHKENRGQVRLSRDGEMARSLIHRLKRLESRFRPGYQRPEIVINCVGPDKEVLRTFVGTATGLQDRPNPRVLASPME